jgi:hypothetical protein
MRELDADTVASVGVRRCCMPSDWTLKGSSDGTEWFVLDRQPHVNLPAGCNCTRAFTLVNKSHPPRALMVVHDDIGDKPSPMMLAGFEVFEYLDQSAIPAYAD